jgi:exosome complex RNA-binding protein Csl4
MEFSTGDIILARLISVWDFSTLRTSATTLCVAEAEKDLVSQDGRVS